MRKFIVFIPILAAAVALFACDNSKEKKIHSATDGGNFQQLKNSANNDDTTSTPNVSSDSLSH